MLCNINTEPRQRPDVNYPKLKMASSTLIIDFNSLKLLVFSLRVSNKFNATCSSWGVLQGSSLIAVASSHSSLGKGHNFDIEEVDSSGSSVFRNGCKRWLCDWFASVIFGGDSCLSGDERVFVGLFLAGEFSLLCLDGLFVGLELFFCYRSGLA
jgi:hypothetical protein